VKNGVHTSSPQIFIAKLVKLILDVHQGKSSPGMFFKIFEACTHRQMPKNLSRICYAYLGTIFFSVQQFFFFM